MDARKKQELQHISRIGIKKDAAALGIERDGLKGNFASLLSPSFLIPSV
jgi:hypothetical protein